MDSDFVADSGRRGRGHPHRDLPLEPDRDCRHDFAGDSQPGSERDLQGDTRVPSARLPSGDGGDARDTKCCGNQAVTLSATEGCGLTG